MLLMMIVAMTIAMPSTYAQYDRALKRAQKKEFKTKMKEYKKGNWTIYDSSHSLDVALLNHYNKLQEDGAREIMGAASAFKSKNVGKQAAFNSALTEYARQERTMVRGRIESEGGGDANDLQTEFDKFYAAYESLVVKEVKGELEHTYSVIRSKGKDKDGNEIFEMQSYFIVNENRASKARIRAMENAFKETELSQQWANKISDFVREGFEPKTTNEE